jgi:hypothetical protein
MLNFDEILLELSYRINSGVIDLNKEEQIKMLHQILTENNIESPTEIINKAKIYFSLLNEASAYKAVSKESGKIVQFTNKDNYQDALKAGTHADVNSKQGKEILKKGGEKNKPSKGISVFGPGSGATVFPTDKKEKTKKQQYKPTESQVKVFKGRKKVLIDVIEKGFLSRTEKITKGVGAFEPTEKQLEQLVDITKKQLKNPSYRRKLPRYKIEEEDIDVALGILKHKLGNEEYKKLEQRIMKAGAVDSFLTTGEKGKKRLREIVKKYLETGGRSAITGEFVPFNRMQLDHHIPFSSAKKAAEDKKRKGIKTSVEQEKEKLDSAPNWDLMETQLNQFKNSLEGSELIEKANRRLNMSPDEKELKKIQQELQSIQKEHLFTNLVQSFGKADYSGFDEESISNLSGEEANMLAKAWNYWHPNPKTPEFRDNLKNDPNYLQKLKKAGIDPDKVDSSFVFRYQAQVGGSRTRGVIKSPTELKQTIYKMMRKAGVVSSKKEKSETDTALAKAVLSIQKRSKELSAREKELKLKIKSKNK